MSSTPAVDLPVDETASRWRASVLVLALTLAFTLSYVDRQVLALLVEPITADLGINDTQFGLLQGLAFALFYVGFGLPLGRLADSGSRRNLIVVGVGLWSVMTIACGAATSFLALFCTRAGVGVGEATLSPAAYSMISDTVPKRHLSFALGVYHMGVYLGAGAALLVGGILLKWLSQTELGGLPFVGHWSPWRLVFLCVGAPGLIMASALILLREPRRTQFDGSSTEVIPTVREAARFLLAERRVFGALILGFSCHNIMLYALLGWTPAFLGRRFDLQPADVGLALGLVTSLGGCAGLLVGGFGSDRLLAAKRGDAPLLVGIIAMMGIGLAASLMLFASDARTASLAFGLVMFFVALPLGSVAAAIQLVAPNRFRAQVSALYITSISLAGLLLGPLLPPLISDRLLGNPIQIGTALFLTVVIVCTISISCLLVGRGAYARRYAAIHFCRPFQEDCR